MERYHIFKLGLAILFYAAYCIRPMMVNCLKIDNAVGSTTNETKNFIEEDFVYYQGVQGKPGVDFPVLSHIPRTSFNCKSVDSGYYADLETDCQVFHICEEGKKISFLCPNGTIFQQSELICEWWFKVNCTDSPNLYQESAEQLREENARRKASRRVDNHGAVMRMEESVSTSHSGSTRRVFEENSRKENRINNHAPTYRNNHLDDRQSDDLNRASTSDIVRNGNNNYRKPAPFSTSSPPQRKESTNTQNSISRRRQDQNYDDYQYDDDQGRNSDHRRTGNFRNQNDQSTSVRGRKPAPFSRNNNFQQHNQQFDSNFEEKNSNNFQQSSTTTFDNNQPVTESNHQRFGTKESSSSTTSFQSSFENSGGFQQQGRFNNDHQQRTTESNQRSSFGGSTRSHQSNFGSNSDFQQQENIENNQQQSEFNQQSSFDDNGNNFNQPRGFNNNEQTFAENNKNSNQPSSFGGNSNLRQQSRFDNNRQHSFSEHNQRNNHRSGSRKNEQTFSQRSSFRGNTKFHQSNNHQTTTESNNYNSNNNQQYNSQSNHQSTSVRNGQDFSNPNQHFQEKNKFNNRNQNTQNRFNADEEQPNSNNNQHQDVDKSNDGNIDLQQNNNENNFNSNNQGNTDYNDDQRSDFDASNRQPIDRSSTFQPFSTINEEFDANSKEEKPLPSTINDGLSRTTNFRENRKLDPTRNRFGANENRQDFNTQASRPFPEGHHPYFHLKCEHFRFNPQFPASFQPLSTTSKSEAQQAVPLSSNFDLQNRNEERTTTVAPTTVTSISSQSTTTPQEERKQVSGNVGFPNLRHEAAFSTERNNQNRKITTPQTSTTKNIEGDRKSSTKQKSTVPLTRNDIVNRKLEPNDSEEAQITQETASFYKNSFNSIDQNYKSTSPNPHPNHRETYSELKEPKHYSTKILSAISSVTPQYLTTQPINNGRPFIGSQVGTTLRKDQGITTTTNSNYFSTTFPPTTTTSDQFTTDSTTTVTPSTSTETTTFFPTTTLSTVTTYKPQNAHVVPLRVNSISTTTSTNRPNEISTNKIIDHATVYGKFAKSGATTPSVQKISLSLSKTLSGSSFNKVTPTPLSVPLSHVRISGSIQNTTTSTSNKNSAEILSTSNSFNSGVPQVRFFGKVQTTTTKIPGVEIRVNGGRSSPAGFNTTPKPRGKALNFGDTSPNSVNSLSTTSKSNIKFSVGSTLPTNLNSFRTSTAPTNGLVYFTSTTPQPFRKSPNFGSTLPVDFTTFSTTPNFNENFGTTTSVVPTSSVYFSTTPQPLSIGTSPADFDSFSTTPEFGTTTGFETTTSNPVGTTFSTRTSHRFSSNRFSTSKTTPQSPSAGFYVTKTTESTTKSLINDIIRPRPFQLPPEPEVRAKPVYSTTLNSVISTATPTFPTYKISSASPFTIPSSPEPTQPTPFTTARSNLPSTFENIDSMINALAEMATNQSSRPGLVIPPSAGPQTLHTLAVYFANALDGIASDKEDHEEEEEHEEEDNLTEKELQKKKLTELLTKMTMDRYNELFTEDGEEVTTISSRNKSSSEEEDDNDLEGQHSKNPTPAPKVRQLAKVFTQALSSYLDDPVTFKKVLEEVRPTEPPEKEEVDLGDDELLNFSDADVRSSFPPVFPTPLSARPTWGFLIAVNTSEVKNSINGDGENLQGADSQSFVSQLNKLNQNTETSTKSSIQLPEDHWTTSPGVTKLWKSAFNFDPASINENFGGTTTEPTTTTEGITEEPHHHEIKYELRALSNLELNSTQVHGILIDFMNTTKSDGDNRLQRILRKLNTTEEEFLAKMKAIEGNPLTRRLILLLISECGANATEEVRTKAEPIDELIDRNLQKKEVLETSSTTTVVKSRGGENKGGDLKDIVDPSLDEDSEDARALQLLNSLYTIASRFGK